MKAFNKWIFLAVLAMLSYSCKEQPQKKEHGGQEVIKTMKVTRSDQTLVSPYTARLTGRQIVEIRPQVSGTITRICINEGQQVRKGQTLFIIDRHPTGLPCRWPVPMWRLPRPNLQRHGWNMRAAAN